MTDIYVGGRSADMAVLLLAAAEELGLDHSVVRTTSKGYLVPQEVADLASAGPAEAAAGWPPVAPKPAQTDNKAAWVDYAVSQGVSRTEAEDQTKAALIEQFKE